LSRFVPPGQCQPVSGDTDPVQAAQPSPPTEPDGVAAQSRAAQRTHSEPREALYRLGTPTPVGTDANPTHTQLARVFQPLLAVASAPSEVPQPWLCAQCVPKLTATMTSNGYFRRVNGLDNVTRQPLSEAVAVRALLI
jgi:hypothetical protein